VGALSRDDIAGFHDHWYRAPNLVVAAAGAVDHEALVSQVGEAFAGRTGGLTPVNGRLLGRRRGVGVRRYGT